MQVQLKHETLTNQLVSTQASEFMQQATADSLDQYWIANNYDGEEYYSVGATDPNFDASTVPETFAGLPVRLMDRGGAWGWHGHGQVSVVAIIKLRRLENITIGELPHILLYGIGDYLSQRFNQDYVVNYVEDPGVYTSSGAKVVSFGIDVKQNWLAFKVSFNLNVDMAGFNAAEICGIKNRSMANLMPDAALTKEQYAEFGESVVRFLIPRIYQTDVEILS